MNPVVFADIVNQHIPEPQSSLLNGILFGLPINKYSPFYEKLQHVGLLHLVVLSGMNITILALIVGKITAGFGKKKSLLITMLTIIFFVIFVSPQAPIVRAAIMGLLTFTATLYGRRSSGLYLLFISAFFIALIWPQWLTQISFYLSFGATLGLLLFSPLIRTENYIISEIKTSLAAQVFTVPLIFLVFKQVSFIAPVSNLFVSWTIGPLMIFGFLLAILGKIHFLLGVIPGFICYGLLLYMTTVIEILDQIPFSFIQF